MKRLLWFFPALLLGSTELSIKKSTLVIDGQPGKVYAVDGKTLWQVGDQFDVSVANDIGDLSALHWHGLTCPVECDGTPYVTQAPIAPDRVWSYKMTLNRPGTFFIQGSFGFQQQSLLAAPLIVQEPGDTHQQVVMLLQDICCKLPKVLWLSLRNHLYDVPPRHNTTTRPALNDLDYDAFLANGRTLDNAEVVSVYPGKPVRLRIINAAAMTTFFIKPVSVNATAIATDGNPILPFVGDLFCLTPGQRVDLILDIPATEGAYPILAEVEGTAHATGMILKTADAKMPNLKEYVKNPLLRPIDSRDQFVYVAKEPLSTRKPDRHYELTLRGNVFNYIWSINNQLWPHTSPLEVADGERIELILNNESQCMQSLHLHGHRMQIVNIDGVPVNGAMRDTVYVLAGQKVAVQFDANNPGLWALASQHLYRKWSGMMTSILYTGYKPPHFTRGATDTYYHRYGGFPTRLEDSIPGS